MATIHTIGQLLKYSIQLSPGCRCGKVVWEEHVKREKGKPFFQYGGVYGKKAKIDWIESGQGDIVKFSYTPWFTKREGYDPRIVAFIIPSALAQVQYNFKVPFSWDDDFHWLITEKAVLHIYHPTDPKAGLTYYRASVWKRLFGMG